MPRLASEGVVGADAIFACLGPALEVFSRYDRVEKASGEQVTLREYLEYVWAAVSKEALSMIFADADATGLEEDARLTAMWLWTLSTGSEAESAGASPEEDDQEDNDDEKATDRKTGGFTLEYDTARKIAQGLGANLETLRTIVEIKGNKARLLPVQERSPKTGEIRRQRRTGEINKRSQLQKIIEQSLNDNPSLDEFIRLLTAKGVSVRLRKSKEGKIEGISYKLDGVAFQGRQLGKDYTWTSLESILLKETSYQPSQSDLITQPDLIEFTTLVSENQEVENNKLEQQKKRSRDKYISLATQVCKLPQFEDRDTRDIDLGVTLLSLKSGDNLEEARMILTQSDTVRQWHQELSRDTYLKLARKYIQQVTNKASELVYKHRSKDELQY